LIGNGIDKNIFYLCRCQEQEQDPMSIFTVLTWLMFVGFFPLSFFWLKRAWVIGKRKDYSYVALKRGIPPKDPQKYAGLFVATNLISGLVIFALIVLIVLMGLSYQIWTAVAGTTIWIKLFAEFIISRHAHMNQS
jgi:hypothetical protein